MEEKDQQIIERYFAGELTAGELVKFEQRVAVDPDFRAAVQLDRDLTKGILAYGEQDLRATLTQIQLEEIDLNKKRQGLLLSPVVKIAIAATLLILISVAAWRLFFKSTNETIFREYALYSFNFIDKSNANSLLEEAQLFAEKGQFQDAILKFDQYLSAQPNDVSAHLGRGMALLAVGNTEAAIIELQSLSTGSSIHQNEARWYMALAYLKINRLKETKETLSVIPKTSVRFEDAQALLESVRSIE